MGLVSSIIVAGVLLVAGVLKLARPAEWYSDAAGMGVPKAVATPVPYLEVVVGALLLVQLQRSLFSWAAVALFAAFTLLLMVRLAQGKRPHCACFGSLSASPIGARHVARNVAFIALAACSALL